jgi:hypothetical protein
MAMDENVVAMIRIGNEADMPAQVRTKPTTGIIFPQVLPALTLPSNKKKGSTP